MAHIWVRAEQREMEQRVGLTPDGARTLLDAGHRVTVEDSAARAIPIDGYAAAGCTIAPAHSWPDAPSDAIIFGLKELDADGPDLTHRHIMFGHAYKGQADGPALRRRFRRGGGTLLDLEYLLDETGRRIAAFGYWAGFAGAAIGLKAWIAQKTEAPLGAIGVYPGKAALLEELRNDLAALPDAPVPTALVIGALGRVGSGACDLCAALGLAVTRWDKDETANGGPFPEILDHEVFVNCILAGPSVPVFIPAEAVAKARRLSVIADVSCDPSSSYNPIPIYNHSTTFADPLIRVTDSPVPLDVMAIDNLPSMLPVESSEDYAAQLLPYLQDLDANATGVWARAGAIFETHIANV
ncbi:saccharopine dehydrogenase [Fluviibacterium sp. DFM31]|uniref:Saccharopine dehydrogenase [NAD(+), L-lysine-forming] n=1 Tax=Meridianimarinicoccus marinus TaxID=3231483 RepID=A0ABV3L5H0_9RHOB